MITVKEFLEKITNPDRIKIVKGEEVLFAGYKGALVHEGAADLSPDVLEAEMVSFRIDPLKLLCGIRSTTAPVNAITICLTFHMYPKQKPPTLA